LCSCCYATSQAGRQEPKQECFRTGVTGRIDYRMLLCLFVYFLHFAHSVRPFVLCRPKPLRRLGLFLLRILLPRTRNSNQPRNTAATPRIAHTTTPPWNNDDEGSKPVSVPYRRFRSEGGRLRSRSRAWPRLLLLLLSRGRSALASVFSITESLCLSALSSLSANIG